MKFHAPSFLLGVAAATAVAASRERLRPVAVEIGALGVHLAQLGRSLLARRREDLEDLWAEIADRVEARVRAPEPASGHVRTNGAAQEAGRAAG